MGWMQIIIDFIQLVVKSIINLVFISKYVQTRQANRELQQALELQKKYADIQNHGSIDDDDLYKQLYDHKFW